jgi:hypothetical protein
MLIIKHRVNSRKELNKVPFHYGIEADVQLHNNEIYLGHDPGQVTERFVDFMNDFNHRIFAVNIKQEGIEEEVLEILERFRCDRFFLFDVSFPQLMRLMATGESRIALRISDFESLSNIELLLERISWLWIDSFFDANYLQELDFLNSKSVKKCLVSPELHTSRPETLNQKIFEQLSKISITFDAVCTKQPEIWESR